MVRPKLSIQKLCFVIDLALFILSGYALLVVMNAGCGTKEPGLQLFLLCCVGLRFFDVFNYAIYNVVLRKLEWSGFRVVANALRWICLIGNFSILYLSFSETTNYRPIKNCTNRAIKVTEYANDVWAIGMFSLGVSIFALFVLVMASRCITNWCRQEGVLDDVDPEALVQHGWFGRGSSDGGSFHYYDQRNNDNDNEPLLPPPVLPPSPSPLAPPAPVMSRLELILAAVTRVFAFAALPRDVVEEQECVICSREYTHDDELRSLSCKHAFHRECIDKWLELNIHCPICRLRLSLSNANKD